MARNQIELGRNFSVHADNIIINEDPRSSGFGFDSTNGSSITCQYIDEYYSNSTPRDYSTSQGSGMKHKRTSQLPTENQPGLLCGFGGVIEGEVSDYQGFPEIQQMIVVSKFTPEIDDDGNVLNLESLQYDLDQISTNTNIAIQVQPIWKKSVRRTYNLRHISVDSDTEKVRRKNLNCDSTIYIRSQRSIPEMRQALAEKKFCHYDRFFYIPDDEGDLKIDWYKDTVTMYIAIAAFIVRDDNPSITNPGDKILSNFSRPITLQIPDNY